MSKRIELMKRHLETGATITRFVCYDPKTLKWIERTTNGKYIQHTDGVPKSYTIHETIQICIDTDTIRCNERMFCEIVIDRLSTKVTHLNEFAIKYKTNKTETVTVRAKNPDDAISRCLPIVRKTAISVKNIETNESFKVQDGITIPKI